MVSAALFMTRSLQIQCRPPRHEDVRAEDDHEAAGDDHAAVSKRDNDPAHSAVATLALDHWKPMTWPAKSAYLEAAQPLSVGADIKRR